MRCNARRFPRMRWSSSCRGIRNASMKSQNFSDAVGFDMFVAVMAKR